MADTDIARLVNRDAAALDGLEDAIWTRADEALSMRRAVKRLAACQAGILLLAMVSFASLGAIRAADAHEHRANPFFTADLTPSALLLGGKK